MVDNKAARRVGTSCPCVTVITGVRARVAPKQVCTSSEFTRGHDVPTLRESRIFADMHGLGDKDEGNPAENNRCHSIIGPGQLLATLSSGASRW
ncbi:hypothetical protein CFter6_1790 [Collimonas fungivorans]|uniref:Uncharacterized protein n=1 Tax=Collimonas fungivorans TaxID=158899 RepID=A0A127P9Q1_9BURK|nr:hypothetical protein CFter6_1790 [Collimonas fungivorans]